MNTPETPIFHKKDNLFGLYESRQEIRKQDLAILCEGQTDVISAHQSGLKNIVAPLGTGLTTEQIEKLLKYSKNILFLFDDDDAGQQAIERGFKIVSELKAYPFANNTHPEKDLDEYIKSGRDISVFTTRPFQDAFSYMISNFISKHDLSNLDDRNKIFKYIENLLSTVKEKRTLEYYKSKAYKLTSFEAYNSKSSFSGTQQKKSATKNNDHPASSMKAKKEFYFIQYLTMLDDIQREDLLDPDLFKESNLSSIL